MPEKTSPQIATDPLTPMCTSRRRPSGPLITDTHTQGWNRLSTQTLSSLPSESRSHSEAPLTSTYENKPVREGEATASSRPLRGVLSVRAPPPHLGDSKSGPAHAGAKSLLGLVSTPGIISLRGGRPGSEVLAQYWLLPFSRPWLFHL